MRANRKLQLEEKFIHRSAHIAVTDAAQLAAKLAELRRPERHRGCQGAIGEAGRRQVARYRAIGRIDAHPGEPAPLELTVGRGVETLQLPIDVGTVVDDRLQTSDE